MCYHLEYDLNRFPVFFLNSSCERKIPMNKILVSFQYNLKQTIWEAMLTEIQILIVTIKTLYLRAFTRNCNVIFRNCKSQFNRSTTVTATLFDRKRIHRQLLI